MHKRSSSFGPSQVATLTLATAAGVAALVLGGDGPSGGTAAPPPSSAAVEPAAFDPSQLTYEVVTRSGSTAAACRAATPRTTNGVIVVPTLVRTGNGVLPDTSVVLAVVPTGADTLALALNINRLVSSTIRAQIEIVVKPTGGSPERVSLGYDGCEAGAPNVYNQTISVADGRLSLSTTDVLPVPALTLLASEFSVAPDGTRTDSRVVRARLAPMPRAMSATVATTGPDSYQAKLRAAKGTNVQLHHALFDTDGGSSTLDAEIGSFPGRLDVDLSPTRIEYVAQNPAGDPPATPIDFVDIASTTIEPGDGEERLRARLEQVPARATLERTSDSRVEVTAPVGPIGSATVSYASIPEGTSTVPTLVPQGNQYLVARKVHDLLLAEVRVEGLTHAVIDAGDPEAGPDPETGEQTDLVPTVVEATHEPGPFVIDAAVTTRPENSPVDVTRTAVARVLDLPGTASVEFGAATQSFDYEGSADIALLTADITSTEPFVDDATAAHLRVENFPTGLEGRFDEDHKKFTANVPDGAIGKIELQATSGPDLRLPVGIDGLLLEDHDGAYTAFARVTGLERIDLGWGTTMRADVEHAPGPFDVLVDVDDPDTADPATNRPATDLDLGIGVRDLPGDALLEYTPSAETECPASPCPKTPSTLEFTGDGAVGSIDLDVVSSQKLIEGGEGNQGATELHGLIENIPAGTLNVVVDGDNKQMKANLSAAAPDFVVELEACSAGECGTPIETLRLPAGDPDSIDGLWLEDLEDSYHLFGRITGLTDLTLNWSDNVVVQAQKAAGPFDIVVNERKLLDEAPLPDIPYGSRTSVAIRNLPSSIDLSLAKGAKSLTYNGSAPISSIEAWLSVDRVVVDTPITDPEIVNAITGRATEAHFLINDLPTTVTLSTDIAEEGDESELLSATLTATPNTIGSILIELTSDESLLDAAAVQEVPVMSTDDGLLFWDLDDGDANTVERIEDPYLIVARVNQLRSVHFEQYKLGEEFRDKVIAAEMDRATHRNIWIDVLKPSEDKAPRSLPGFTPQYKYEYVRMGMDVPPEKLKFEAYMTRKDNGDFRTLRVETHADADATSMTVETDAGSESLTSYLQPVPAGATYADPGAVACVSPGSMDCQPDHRVDYAGSEPVSVALEVAKPVHIDVVRVERKPTINPDIFLFPEFHVHMDIEKYMQASKEVDFENCNEYFLFVDTDEHGIQGDITDYTSGGPGGGTDLDIHLPPGTMADNRWVKLEGPPCHTEIVQDLVGSGQAQVMSCPSGLDIVIDAFEDIDVHVEDEICPEPRIRNVEDGATGQPVVVSRSSNGGDPVTLTMHLYGSGFAPITCSPDFAQWPPCSGPAVAIGRFVNGIFQPNNNFDVMSRTWHGTDHVEVVVEVDADTPLGNWAVRVDNPETGTGTCTTQEVDGEDVPCFSVVE
jgi:hypothetical protein